MSNFGEPVNNSKLTPEFHLGDNGQVGNATDNNQSGDDNQLVNTPNNEGQVGTNDGNQSQNPTEGINVGEETFNSQDELIEAYNNMKQQLETRNTSYKELQSAYTKSRQEIAMRNKMARPENNPHRDVPIAPIIPPMPNMQNPVNPYFNPMNQPYSGIQGGVPRYNNMGMQPQYPNYQPQQQTAGNLVNQTMIDMAVENKLMELKSQDANFDEVASELWNIMDTDNLFKDMVFVDADQAKNAIATAYEMAKQKVETAKTNIKINNAKVEAYQNKQQKLLNNDMSNVAKKNNKQQEKTDEQKIKDSIIGAIPQRF